MSKSLEALEAIGFCLIDYDGKEYTRIRDEYAEDFEDVEKELKALEIIKDFVWIENDEIHLGLYGDSEIVLRENDFESKEKYDLLKEVLL